MLLSGDSADELLDPALLSAIELLLMLLLVLLSTLMCMEPLRPLEGTSLYTFDAITTVTDGTTAEAPRTASSRETANFWADIRLHRDRGILKQSSHILQRHF
jgi:hypothetical protein